jgi:hypothetical protein
LPALTDECVVAVELVKAVVVVRAAVDEAFYGSLTYPWRVFQRKYFSKATFAA